MLEKRRRMSSAGGDRGRERGQDADHLRPQFLIINRKHIIRNISRTESAMIETKPKCFELFEALGWSSSIRLARLAAVKEKFCGYLNENGSNCKTMVYNAPPADRLGAPG
jgi:hypothetical protein